MREPYALLGTTCLLVAGCFGPLIGSGAFRCDPQDDPPCPTGFFCVDNRCVSGAAEVDQAAPLDLGSDAGTVEDLAVAGGDLAHAPSDLTAPRDLLPPPDLTPPPDLVTGVCGHAGSPCTTIQDCCSMYCRTDGICIGG